MKLLSYLTILLFLFGCKSNNGIEKQNPQSFPLSDVRLLENSPFYNAQEANKTYLLELKADRLLAPFLREAGLPQKAESYPSWENTGLDGHIGGHYLSALSMMYASTGDTVFKSRLNYMVDELKRCQDANGNGYIGGVPGGKVIWEEVANGNIRAELFSLNGKWVPLYNIHKTYAGLRDAWLFTQNEKAKEMLIDMTDWAVQLVHQLTEEQIQDMLHSEHGGLNETFADVAAITGNQKYLTLARQFSHKFLLDPLLAHRDELTGLHANTQIPKVLGFKRVADLDGDTAWSEAARFFWENVTQKRSACIGGNSTSEHFHPTDDFSSMIKSIEGPETCNTYNMMRLSKMFYETSADKKYIEYYERALYNHILSTQHPRNGGLVYFTQMRPGHYRVYSQTQECMWCCVGSGIENHSKYGEMIYAHTANDLYVNLFIPSTGVWKEKGVTIRQETAFPEKETTTLIIEPEEDTRYTLYIRYPEWVKESEMELFLSDDDDEDNYERYPVNVKNGYAVLDREWESGDKVKVKLPMDIRVEQMPDHSNYYAYFYGPIALAAKTSQDGLTGLYANSRAGAHIAHGPQIPLQEMPILVTEPDKLLNCLTKVEGDSLSFRLTNLYPTGKWGELELIPFYRLHDSRYIIYWNQATEEGVRALQEEIGKQEEKKIYLDAITVDRVISGQQQPESDHAVRSERSTIGYTNGVHWREAGGWFSYDLRNADGKGQYLYIAYLDEAAHRYFDIFVNDSQTEGIRLQGENELKYKVIPVPESEKGKDTLTIRFKARTGAVTAKIAETRLLNSEFN